MKNLNRGNDRELNSIGKWVDRAIAAVFALGVLIIVGLFLYVLFTQVILKTP